MSLWDWIVELVTGAPTQPPTSPNATHDPTVPPTDPPTATLAGAILHYNNVQPAFVAGPVRTLPAKGVVLHEIDEPTAGNVAAALEEGIPPADDADAPFALCVALIASESAFDPACENGNLDGSNRANDPAGYDVGLCQLKLKYLTPGNVDLAREIALDPFKAVGHLVSDLRENVRWARASQVVLGSNPEPSALDPYWFAVAAYKHGKTGALAYARTRSFPRNRLGKAEADQVADLEVYFAKALLLKVHIGGGK